MSLPGRSKAALDSGFFLRIESGATRHPVRPIVSGRFLIGAGSNCQLQLGGNIPMLHSIILPQGDHLWIDAVSATPPLIVNGHPMRDGQINQGDVIEIGEFVFSVDYKTPLAVPEPETAAGPERSAAELLAHLESEMAELNQFEARQRSVGTALREAIAQHMETPQTQSHVDHRAAILQLLAELHERSRALDEREASLSAHADRLAQSHEELRQQLQALCDSHGGQSKDAEQELRKSA